MNKIDIAHSLNVAVTEGISFSPAPDLQAGRMKLLLAYDVGHEIILRA